MSNESGQRPPPRPSVEFALESPFQLPPQSPAQSPPQRAPQRAQPPPSLFSPPPGQIPGRSPLGEPLNEESARFLVQFPLRWHPIYWLSLGIIGIKYGEDATLMAILVDIEMARIPNERVRNQVIQQWNQFKIDHRQKCLDYWDLEGLDNDEGRAFLRDLDRILVDKVRKAQEYIPHGEWLLTRAMRSGHEDLSQFLFWRLVHLHEALRKIHAQNMEEDRTRLRSNPPGEQDHGEQGPEGMNGHQTDETTRDENSPTE
ncbi:hypothetical protein MMC07_004825 [Pseudocyphellaria aurata]|nr:hypothetical protein [Pseudocyphellaria aurata]